MPAIRTLILSALVLGACSNPEDVEVQSRECLDGSNANYHVRLQGSGLQDYEGSTIHVVTDINLAFTPDALCRSTGAALVEDGALDLRLSNRTDEAVYPFVGAFVDLDDDGLCTPGIDATWGTWGSVAPDTEMLVALEASAFTTVDELEVCAHF